jgi:hypothetical protein
MNCHTAFSAQCSFLSDLGVWRFPGRAGGLLWLCCSCQNELLPHGAWWGSPPPTLSMQETGTVGLASFTHGVVLRLVVRAGAVGTHTHPWSCRETDCAALVLLALHCTPGRAPTVGWSLLRFGSSDLHHRWCDWLSFGQLRGCATAVIHAGAAAARTGNALHGATCNGCL